MYTVIPIQKAKIVATLVFVRAPTLAQLCCETGVVESESSQTETLDPGLAKFSRYGKL